MISLTFDNGPTPGATAVGRELVSSEGQHLGQRVVDEGHRLGGHTFRHDQRYGALAHAALADDLTHTAESVAAAGGDGQATSSFGTLRV